MPITPFHFGPGLLGKGLAARGFSWSAFVASNVVIDLESLYHLATRQYPVHRQLHTFVGAALVGLATMTVLLALRRWGARRLEAWSPAVRGEASGVGIVVGALSGALTHPLLDGVMHGDIEPFQPWTAENPLHGAIELSTLHTSCVIAGCAGAVLLAISAYRGRAGAAPRAPRRR